MIGDVLAAGLALGTTTALLGVAAWTVATATRTLHLAVGAVLVTGVLTSLTLAAGGLGIPHLMAVLVAVGVGAALSAALEPVLLRPLPTGEGWLAGLAVAGVVLEATVARWMTVGAVRPEPLVSLPAIGQLGPAAVTAVVLGGIGTAVLGTAAVRSAWGRRLRLVGGEPAAAERAGIDPARVRAQALAVGGAAAVVAGLLAAPIALASSGQAGSFTVRAVAAALVLAPGGPSRAAGAGLLLGVLEAAGQRAWPAAGGDVALALAVLVLLSARGTHVAAAWQRTW